MLCLFLHDLWEKKKPRPQMATFFWATSALGELCCEHLLSSESLDPN